MNLQDLLTLLLIGLGALTMIFSAIGSRKILIRTRKSPYNSSWRVLLVLILFFTGGYLGTMALVALKFHNLIQILTGTVFLFGALFVYLVVRTGYLTIDDLFKTSFSKRYVENIIDSVDNTILVLGLDGTIKTVNQPLCRLLGYSDRELIGKRMEFLEHSEDPDFFAPLLDRVKAGDMIHQIECSFINREQQRIPISLSISPLVTESTGTIDEIIVAANDITEIKKAHLSVELASKEMNDILNHVSEGLFLINQDHGHYLLGAQHSRALEAIFESAELVNVPFISLLAGRADEKTQKVAIDYLELLFRKDISDKFLPDLNPISDLTIDFSDTPGSGFNIKHLQFRFNRIYHNEQIVHVMVRIRDVTEEVTMTKKLKKSKEEALFAQELLFNMLNVEPGLLSEFIEETKIDIEEIRTALENTRNKEQYRNCLDQIFRNMHTIKGNADVLNMRLFAERAHKYEDTIVQLKENPDLRGSDFLPLAIGLNDIQEILRMSENLIARLTNFQKVFERESTNPNIMVIKALERTIRKFEQESGRTVHLNYKDFNFEEIPDHARLLIKEILIQFARNSIVHGFESHAERIKAGKNEFGTITLNSLQSKDSAFVFTYQDDGQGIQLDRLREKAIEMKRWSVEEIQSWDEASLAKLIYAPGVSTADSLTLGAGRGVGMDIVRKRIVDAGGSIQLSFVPKKFCRFQISLPKTDAAQPQP